MALLPAEDGTIERILFGLGDGADPFLAGKLPSLLPPGTYRLEPRASLDMQAASLAWLLGSYRFTRYRKPIPKGPLLVSPEGVDAAEIHRISQAVALGRDLVNTPANDLGPAEIEAVARALAEEHSALISVTEGSDLAREFPLVHAVGAASPRAPRLIDMSWGDEDAPKVTLVGKGVVFDTAASISNRRAACC